VHIVGDHHNSITSLVSVLCSTACLAINLVIGGVLKNSWCYFISGQIEQSVIIHRVQHSIQASKQPGRLAGIHTGIQAGRQTN